MTARPNTLFTAPGLLLGLLAFLLYANTLGHGFVLDDSLVITKNQFTTKGISGWADIFSTDTFYGYLKIKGKETVITGGRYRPLSLAMFALVYQAVGAKPFLFHLINVILYALTCFLLFKTLHQLFHRHEKESFSSLPFWATLIFVVHPVHTEVVANIKCADELLALLLSIVTLRFILKAVDTGSKKYIIWAGITFLGACFSKENALTWLAVIPLALFFFRNGTSTNEGITLLHWMIPIAVSATVFFIARGSVLHWQFGDESKVLINNPFIKWNGFAWIPFTFAERSAAIIYSLGEYLRLLVLPHPLTHDYYPRQIGLVTWAHWKVWLYAAAGTGTVIAAVWGLRKKTISSFALLYYIATISIVSNIFFPIGTNLSERFIFMPSIGFTVLTSYYLLKIKNNKIITTIIVLLSLLYALKVITRNADWKDNFTLASADIETSSNSAKLNNSFAAQLSEKALKSNAPQEKNEFASKAIKYYTKAIEINPNYIEAFYGRGSAYFIKQDLKGALNDYLAAEKIDPQYPNLQNNLALALREAAKQMIQQNQDPELIKQYLIEAQRRYSGDQEINNLLLQYNQKTQ